MRLDVFLKEKNYFESRKKAADTIKAGVVYVDSEPVFKPSFEVFEQSKIEIKGETLKYVGRGGLKLEFALKEFSVCVKDFICADIGASTGGFTDVLLQNGAEKVFAIDSGTNQLHGKLRDNGKVVVMEQTNARTVTKDTLGTQCDIVVMDVSFISQTLLYECVSSVLKNDGVFISLIKPQFEVGKEFIGKNGIVKDEKARQSVIAKTREQARIYGLVMERYTVSPIKGGDGNIEYLGLFRKASPVKEEHL